MNWNTKPRYNLYSANYANWYFGDDEGSRKTRLEIVQDVATEMIADLEDVNLGLMRYSVNDDGNDEEVGTRRHGYVSDFPADHDHARRDDRADRQLDRMPAIPRFPRHFTKPTST